MKLIVKKHAEASSERLLGSGFGCAGCGACIEGGDKVDMSFSDWQTLLVNSWIKPLLLLVVAAIIAETISLDEPLAVSLGLLAFVLGLYWCRQFDGEIILEKRNE